MYLPKAGTDPLITEVINSKDVTHTTRRVMKSIIDEGSQHLP